MENGRPPWARPCRGPGRGLGPDRWRPRDDDGDMPPGGRFGAWLFRGSPAGTRLPWASTAVLTVFVLVGTRFAGRNQPERVDLDALAYALLLAGTVPLLWRHRFPRTVALGTAVATAVYLAAGYPYGPFLLSVALGCFAAVVAGQRVAAWTAVGLVWASHLLVGHWLYRWLPPSGDGPAPWGEQLFVTVLVVAVVAVSELARVRREQFARMRAERAAAARRRADEERLRIARELHDVLAHSISVINVQAGVGLALLDEDPEQARTALTTIKAASKEVLGEVRQVLATLRTPGDAPRAPAPGLDRLPELCGQAKDAGLAVQVTEQGRRPKLSPGADLAAFRIVQEALTNIVRHSGSRTARVGLVHLPGTLEITVDDDGPATAGDVRGTGDAGAVAGGGNGLVGMRERAAALGGTVEAGPRPDGGFRVHARLPLRTATPAPDATGSARAADTVNPTAIEEES
ncbi:MULTISPECIES: sensor histidine kinase [Streptomyces]|uniref:histidine kinase n=2 Tax=Streptomyces rimosus subsp. rimosus TaxID=132474 RepID=L8EJT5_STRR1|nr:histidine kinase [Streptomyces rimosus]MYT40841.1 sensor histidine kinase [Streptomyces sp. SID5471]QGY66723.1 sensor histidine kinase [Streptomyces rimosus R6-500]QST79815.1 sensor histidine kinase [Streptomyces rimosus subsp. rimosus ATCC 10970]QTL90287.1 sensor histidine kinase [Streptomyces rimosus subsp. rimosus]